MTVAIIMECNPPHKGHEYLLKAVKTHFGQDTRIIGIMSGNYVQRGEPAVMPKTLRAEASLSLGFDLILELPFPFSMSSADGFAAAGVSLAESLGCIDVLAFGSESGDLEYLNTVVQNIESPAFLSARKKISRRVGYAFGFSEDYAKTYPNYPPFPTDSNDLLAIAYLRELYRTKSRIQAFAVRRIGQHTANANDSYRSASEIRAMLRDGDRNKVFDSFPDNMVEILSSSLKNGTCPTDISRLDSAVLSYFRLNPCGREYADAGSGLYKRLASLSCEAVSISDLCSKAQTKNYTAARIRRALWFSFFGITSSELKEKPLYTQFLAANDFGLSLLKAIGKCGNIAVLTKPTDIQRLSPEAKEQKLRSDRADLIYPLFLPSPQSVKEIISFTPYLSHS